MYCGIGLPTTRGSATSGYVQSNVSNLQFSKNRVQYNAEEDIAKAEAMVNRPPNIELLNHEYKRNIEIKCIEFSDLLQGKGYDDDETDARVGEYRKLLLEEFESGGNKHMDQELDVRNSHSRAKIAKDNRDKFRLAFGIDASFVDGSSMANIKKASEMVKAAEVTGDVGLAEESKKLIEKIKKKSMKRNHSSSSDSSSSSSSSSDSSSSSETSSISSEKNGKFVKRIDWSEKNKKKNSNSKLKEPKIEPVSPVIEVRVCDYYPCTSHKEQQKVQSHRKNAYREEEHRNRDNRPKESRADKHRTRNHRSSKSHDEQRSSNIARDNRRSTSREKQKDIRERREESRKHN